MPENKITPGPWSVTKIGHRQYEVNYGDDGECVADLVNSEANANLIRAAPELLEAVQDLLDMAIIPHEGPVFEQARAAIAKANGEKQ